MSVTANEVNEISTNQVTEAGLATGFSETDYVVMAAVADYDEQIADYTDEMAAINAEKGVIRTAETAAENLSNRTATQVDGKDYVSMSYAEFEDLKAKCAEAGVDITQVEGIADATIDVFPVSVLETIEGQLEDKLEALNDVSELKMIGFQSVMDARKQALLMLSNMVSSNHQTMMDIIRNMKS